MKQLSLFGGLAAASLGAGLLSAEIAALPNPHRIGPGVRRAYGTTIPGNFEVPAWEPQRADFPSRQTFRRAHLKWRKRYRA